MDPQTITNVINAIVTTFTAMLTPSMGYLVIGSLMLTQAVKWVAIYLKKNLPAQLIWFVISPLVTGLLALLIWVDATVHWMGAALTASLFSNLAYSIFLKRMVGKAAPEIYRRMNVPIDRRKIKRKIIKERRGK